MKISVVWFQVLPFNFQHSVVDFVSTIIDSLSLMQMFRKNLQVIRIDVAWLLYTSCKRVGARVCQPSSTSFSTRQWVAVRRKANPLSLSLYPSSTLGKQKSVWSPDNFRASRNRSTSFRLKGLGKGYWTSRTCTATDEGTYRRRGHSDSCVKYKGLYIKEPRLAREPLPV